MIGKQTPASLEVPGRPWLAQINSHRHIGIDFDLGFSVYTR